MPRLWCIVIVGCLALNMIHGQDDDASLLDLDASNDPEFKVDLSVAIQPKVSKENHVDRSSAVENANKRSNEESFSCHECIDCHLKNDLSIQVCPSGVQMCYTIEKRIDNINRIIRRGCSTSKSQCTVPSDNSPFDSITCCNNNRCNDAIQVRSIVVMIVLIMLMNFLI